MKNQYVGDIGDFGKVLLLKHLAGLGFRIGVNWVLTENDSTGDGKHRDYINYRGRNCFCSCDQGIMGAIASLAKKQKGPRKICDLEGLIHTFSKDAKFYSRIYPDKAPKHLRNDLDGEAFLKLKDAELIFLDPDNGFGDDEGTSVKHVYLADLDRYWGQGQSLLVYHHLSRQGEHTDQIENLTKRLRGHFLSSSVKAYHFRRGTARVYMLCLQPVHLGRFCELEKVDLIAPLLVSKDEWARERRKRRESCAENHPWYKPN